MTRVDKAMKKLGHLAKPYRIDNGRHFRLRDFDAEGCVPPPRNSIVLLPTAFGTAHCSAACHLVFSRMLRDLKELSPTPARHRNCFYPIEVTPNRQKGVEHYVAGIGSIYRVVAECQD